MRRSDRAYAAIREEAIEWFLSACEEELSVAHREAFLAWLRKSPQHIEAYLRIMALWEDTETLETHARGGLDEAVVRQAAAKDNNIVVLAGSRDRVESAVRGSRSLPSRWRLAAVAAAVGVIVLSFVLMSRKSTIETGVGEQRTVTLADGSRVELNSRSRLRVRFDRTVREVDLLEGQALFSVTKDPERPFLVYSDGTVVRAVGTQFDINQTHGTSVITVVEGRVAVSDVAVAQGSGTDASALGRKVSSSEEASVLVSSGQRVIASAHAIALPQAANPALATAWTEGKLIFDSVPLGEVVEEFNRYLPRPLVVDDPQLQSLHISGVFSVTESQLFIDFLQHRFGTTSRDDGHSIRIATP